MNMDLLDSHHLSVKKDFQIAVRDCYPAGSTVSSLARGLIGLGTGTGTAPDTTTFTYAVPKVYYPSNYSGSFQFKKLSKLKREMMVAIRLPAELLPFSLPLKCIPFKLIQSRN
jgi:hypothetical protein